MKERGELVRMAIKNADKELVDSKETLQVWKSVEASRKKNPKPKVFSEIGKEIRKRTNYPKESLGWISPEDCDRYTKISELMVRIFAVKNKPLNAFYLHKVFKGCGFATETDVGVGISWLRGLGIVKLSSERENRYSLATRIKVQLK